MLIKLKNVRNTNAPTSFSIHGENIQFYTSLGNCIQYISTSLGLSCNVQVTLVITLSSMGAGLDHHRTFEAVVSLGDWTTVPWYDDSLIRFVQQKSKSHYQNVNLFLNFSFSYNKTRLGSMLSPIIIIEAIIIANFRSISRRPMYILLIR